jgi:hypothetical protein
VTGASFEELQGISFDQAREDVSRSFMLVGAQRIEALVTG